MILANFQSNGNLQVRKEYLNRILRGKHIVSEVAFNIWWLYIIEHSLLYLYQSVFLPGHSTVYQLLEIYHNICKNIDNRLSSIIVFCDIFLFCVRGLTQIYK
jgi:hypothetical protein